MSTELYRVLQAQVKERNLTDLNPRRAFLELGLIVAMILGGIALFLKTDSLAFKAVALFISTCGCLGMSTSAHTASHSAASNSPLLNRFLVFFGFPFFFGVSASYWWNKHCVVHHPTPNLVGLDDDIDLAPFFQITDPDPKSGRPRKPLYRLQWLVIPFALALNEFNIQRSGWLFLASRLRDSRLRRSIHFLDAGIVALHWAGWVFLPMFYFPPLHVVGFYSLRMALMGYAMFIGFAPAHFPEEAVTASAREKDADFVLRQTATAVNFRTGPFGALLCNGVQYQIEHHLFPSLSPYHLKELSHVVEKFCKEHGYPYRTLGWWEATWKSLVVFYRPKKVLPTLAECMERPISEPPMLRAASGAGGHGQ